MADSAAAVLAEVRAELNAISARNQMVAHGIDDPDEARPITSIELITDHVANLINAVDGLTDLVDALLADR